MASSKTTQIAEYASSSQEPRAKDVPVAQKTRVSSGLHFVAGGIGGMAGALVTCPLDVIKTRLQSSVYVGSGQTSAPKGFPVASSSGAWGLTNRLLFGVPQIMADIRRVEGLRALWRGLGPNLLGVMPARAIYFSVYNETKRRLGETALLEGKSDLVYIGAAAAAGTATSVATNPIWMVKTRMQLQVAPHVYKNSLDCLVRVTRDEGFLSLYRGLAASLLGICESSVQWVLYERLRAYTSSHDSSVSGSAISSFACAGISKLLAASIAYPHEVIRTRLRQEPSLGHREFTGIWQTLTKTVSREGIPGLYGGLSAHLLRVVPNAAIVFLFYESALKLVNSKNQS